MVKNCIIIHGCPSPKNAEKSKNPETRTYDKHWIPWLKEQLTSKNIKTEIPLMPNPWEPVYEDFKKEFEKYEVSEDSILIGHSCGCAFLTHWLSENEQKIDKLILVAPYKVNDRGGEARDLFYGFKLNPNLNDRINKIVMFTSDNEREGGKKSIEIYSSILKGKIIELKNHGHFTMKDMGKTELPELLNEIL